MSGQLDAFIPVPDVRERHSIKVRAPAAVVYRTARAYDIQSLRSVQTIFRLRGALMGATTSQRARRGFIDDMLALGWGRLLERPGELFVAGAVCQPWMADVVFRPVPAEAFGTFAEPNLVKILWTLETEETGVAMSRLSSETRVVATDAQARARFRRYWRWARFGIIPIRWLLLPAIRRAAEAATSGAARA